MAKNASGLWVPELLTHRPKKRTVTFWNRKILLVSTPTIRGASRIETAYLESDQRQ